jgi:hypothetical protein
MEAAVIQPPKSPAVPVPPRKHVATKPQLLHRARLDQRSGAAREFDTLVASVEADLGGRDQLSAIERALVEAFASSTIVLNHLSTRLLMGEKIDISEHSSVVGAMVRVASRLGLRRRPREVNTPTLKDIVDEYSEDAE